MPPRPASTNTRIRLPRLPCARGAWALAQHAVTAMARHTQRTASQQPVPRLQPLRIVHGSDNASITVMSKRVLRLTNGTTMPVSLLASFSS